MYKAVRGKPDSVKNAFFEKAYLIWFDYCPMFRSIDLEADEYEWRKRCQHKVIYVVRSSTGGITEMFVVHSSLTHLG